MKKITLLVLCLMICLSALNAALGDSLKLGKDVNIDDTSVFRLKFIQTYDKFLGQESGANKEWIVAAFSVLNLSKEKYFVKPRVHSQLTYDDEYEFAPANMWFEPMGSYRYSKDSDAMLFVTSVNEYGKISAYPMYAPLDLDKNTNDSLEDVYVYFKTNNGMYYKYSYNPLTDTYKYKDDQYYIAIETNKYTLDPLVERTYYFAFLVPNMVAKDEGLRVIEFDIDGTVLDMRF